MKMKLRRTLGTRMIEVTYFTCLNSVNLTSECSLSGSEMELANLYIISGWSVVRFGSDCS
jgi:hypothetical protein